MGQGGRVLRPKPVTSGLASVPQVGQGVGFCAPSWVRPRGSHRVQKTGAEFLTPCPFPGTEFPTPRLTEHRLNPPTRRPNQLKHQTKGCRIFEKSINGHRRTIDIVNSTAHL
jgi:hypothetical protein